MEPSSRQNISLGKSALFWLGLSISVLSIGSCGTTAPPPRPPVIVHDEPFSDGAPVNEEPVEDVIDVPINDNTEPEAASHELTTPDFMEERQITRAAVLLPFSTSNARVRGEAEALYAAIELALFDQKNKDFLLMPFDTAGRTDKASQAALQAARGGADIIIGPLFPDPARIVGEFGEANNIPVLSFSTDRAAGMAGALLMSFPAEEDVARVIEWAARDGVTTFAVLAPQTSYGRRVVAAAEYETLRNGAVFAGSEYYGRNSESQQSAAKTLSNRIRPIAEAVPQSVAVIIPDSGTQLRAVGPLIPYNGLDARFVRLLGTSFWDDPNILREASFNGASFAVTDPRLSANFEAKYEAVYGAKPLRLSSLGYDAAALAIGLSRFDDGLTRGALLHPDGYKGVNGLFRFRNDGSVQRGLSVLRITNGSTRLVEAAPRNFDAPGS